MRLVFSSAFLLAAGAAVPWTARVTILCFLASYLVALGLEVWRMFRSRPVLWVLALAMGGAGLIAQTIYLAVQQPALVWQSGWMLFTAWILAIFYLAGSLHHPRLAWGVFVLPVILGLVGLAVLGDRLDPPPSTARFLLVDWISFQTVHAALLLLGSIGLCVGFVASLMYLIQAHRLKAKLPPNQGMKLLNLERLEAMNRRAVTWAFPLLTLGMLIGAVLMFVDRLPGWSDPRVWATVILWLAVALLLYVRYGLHLRGRQLAVLTIVAFGLLLGCLSLSHPVGKGSGKERPDGIGEYRTGRPLP